MAILVTGGTGYIGSHTVVDLLNHGYDVVILDNYSNSKPEVLNRIYRITGKEPRFYFADIQDYEAMKKVFEQENITDIIHFAVKDQKQIIGSRGYVNSTKKHSGYDLIRTMALPFVSYISVMKVQKNETGEIFFYWRPFADFTQMASMQYAAQNYGKGKQQADSKQRKKQVKYREELYNVFHHCPFTHIDEFRLLIASHIKPYAVSTQKEQSDPNNGIMLSPLYDKLFDKGFISFDENGNLLVSDWLSPQNKERISFNYSLEDLFLNDQRKKYLKYHRENVFK